MEVAKTFVYFIMLGLSISAERCMELFQAKFGSYNPFIINKAMTYFVDVDNEPELKMLKPVSWECIKRFFIEMFTRL